MDSDLMGHDKGYPGENAVGGEAERTIEQELESLFNICSFSI